MDRAALAISWSVEATRGSGAWSAATRVSFGRASLSSSNRFALSSKLSVVRPVTFPPGRARLATSPISTGRSASANTIGIVGVTRRTICVNPVPQTMITSGSSLTTSAARAPYRSALPSAYRYSTAIFRPST